MRVTSYVMKLETQTQTETEIPLVYWYDCIHMFDNKSIFSQNIK